MKREVNYTLKILSALGIIFVVAGHCSNMGLSLAYEWFPPYSFHLALFVFISGYFYLDLAEDSVKSYIIKKFKSLIIPTLLWNIVYGFITVLLKRVGFTIGGDLTLSNIFIIPIMHGHQFMYNLASWFVIPLFCVEIINVCFRKICKIFKVRNEIFILCIYLALGILGIELANMGYIYSFYLLMIRIMFFLPCFSFGRIYKEYLEKRDNLNSCIYFLVIFMLTLIIQFKYGYTGYTIASCNDFTNGPILPFISAIIGIAFWLRISKILTPILENNRIILLVANNTYSIMMHHLMGFMVVKAVFYAIHKYTSFCGGFDVIKFKSDIFYYYFPHGLSQFALFYGIFGIVFSLLIKYFCTSINNYLKK